MEDITQRSSETLAKLKECIEGYHQANNVKPQVSQHLENVKQDDKLLLLYLQARKNRVAEAWDTLRRYTENKFLHYPNVYLDVLPDQFLKLVRNRVYGVLRHRDKYGRRIIFLDTTKWDINEFSVEDLSVAAVIAAEAFWKEPEVLQNGLIFVENSGGFSKAHAKQHTLYHLMRMKNILQSFPISMQKIIYLQTPSVFNIIFSLAKPILPRKLRKRISVYSANQIPTELLDIASPEILPKWMGGMLEAEDATEDESFFKKFVG